LVSQQLVVDTDADLSHTKWPRIYLGSTLDCLTSPSPQCHWHIQKCCLKVHLQTLVVDIYWCLFYWRNSSSLASAASLVMTVSHKVTRSFESQRRNWNAILLNQEFWSILSEIPTTSAVKVTSVQQLKFFCQRLNIFWLEVFHGWASALKTKMSPCGHLPVNCKQQHPDKIEQRTNERRATFDLWMLRRVLVKTDLGRQLVLQT